MRYRVELVGRGILGVWVFLSNAQFDLERRQAQYRALNPNLLVRIWDVQRHCWVR